MGLESGGMMIMSMPKDAAWPDSVLIHPERLITMQHIAIHGPRPRPYARAHIAAAGAAHRDAPWLPGAAISFADYELLGDAADIMARQRTRQRW
jgi:hypothetical protein